eukprot:scaffold1061_cov65-Cyclotella_meneghiniana.AAC.5
MCRIRWRRRRQSTDDGRRHERQKELQTFIAQTELLKDTELRHRDERHPTITVKDDTRDGCVNPITTREQRRTRTTAVEVTIKLKSKDCFNCSSSHGVAERSTSSDERDAGQP